MPLRELASMSLSDDPGPDPPPPSIPDDIANTDDRYFNKLKSFAQHLPYPIETNSRMQKMLQFICTRIVQAIEAKDYDPGFFQWNSMLTYWAYLRYPIPKETRILLVKLYFGVCTIPGMPLHVVATCCEQLGDLTRSHNKLSIQDLRLPWLPLFQMLRDDLFLTRRQFEVSQMSYWMSYLVATIRRFFHPAAIEEMLSHFVPLVNGTLFNSLLTTQYYMLTFLPQSHPQVYLPMLFRIWESVNSYMYDERMLQFLARLAELHQDPAVSDPRRIPEIPDDEQSPGEGRPTWSRDDLKEGAHWTGVYKDVGIFTEHDWHLIMCKCLASMEIPLADSGSLTTGPSADNEAGWEIGRLPKPTWRIISLARLIVYSMAPDSLPSAPSTNPTPFVATPLASGTSTPRLMNSLGSAGSVGDYLTATLGKAPFAGLKTYTGGSKALDSLVKLIASTESFFHPSNSGAWTSDLTAFIRYVAYEFNKRWHEEQKSDCKTPTHRRLTKAMKRELVHSLRTVALLAMFSEDSNTAANVTTALKWMSLMEPDLIVRPILERAVPALENLTETQRTLAVIRALGAVAPALVSREIYAAGAKHLLPILQLLIPGIDLNDPSKTSRTTTFLVEVSQYINRPGTPMTWDGRGKRPMSGIMMPSEFVHERGSAENCLSEEPELSPQEEDAVLREATGGFPEWVASFIRRVILLFDNLPKESNGSTEVQMVDSVTNACRQICAHLSGPLFDLVLGIVFDFVSTSVRPHAVRAVHQLVECVANADPAKTLARFFPLCVRNIYVELESGASSVRTTNAESEVMPADATFHWSLAILRGAVYNDGKAVMKYRDEIIPLLQLLRYKTFAQSGFSWSGRFLSRLLLTLTSSYPLEDRFMNPKDWESEDFRRNHHRYWGKLYMQDEIAVSWHVPDKAEIDFAIQIFKEVVEPALNDLEKLLGIKRDGVWRNDFCRYLNFVRMAFSGTPTIVKEIVTKADQDYGAETSDILNEAREMIAFAEPLNAGFAINDPEDPRAKYYTELRRQFGRFLHEASVSLRHQGEENTVDAVSMLVQSISTYMMNYGDSKDDYYTLNERYVSELGYARQYPGQKAWPRSVFIRRAELYNATRLKWCSIERKRGPLEDLLIDDITEWALWNYASVRESSQVVLEQLVNTYDGARRRAIPIIYKALDPTTEDDRMKGALYTFKSNSFVRLAVSDYVQAPEALRRIFACQGKEKVCLFVCVGSFIEPNFVVYKVDHEFTGRALAAFRDSLSFGPGDAALTAKVTEQRRRRVQLQEVGVRESLSLLQRVANDQDTHWRYAIFATRCLRTLIRKDAPTSAEQVKYFLEKCRDNHPTMYSQRAILKSTRFIKLRTFARSPEDLLLERNNNPLKRRRRIANPSKELTKEFLDSYRRRPDLSIVGDEPVYFDKAISGWLAWADTIPSRCASHMTKPSLKPWDKESEGAVDAIREAAQTMQFWKDLSVHYAAETGTENVTSDNIAVVKSIVQILEDESFQLLQDLIEDLIAQADQNKQRGAAEFLAGLLNGTKNWPTNSQRRLWEWAMPLIRRVFSQMIKTDTLPIWTSFLDYMLLHKDPRRYPELVDYLVEEFEGTDYNGESSLSAVKALAFFRAFYEDACWKFSAWTEDAVSRVWGEMASEHDDVRKYISDLLTFTDRVKWTPRPSVPSAEVFVRECRTLSNDVDVIGIRGTYHLARVQGLVHKFPEWREERLPGARAFQSTYDRVGVSVCRWLFLMLHDAHAISAFDYIVPLMPELFRFTELNDNDDLYTRAKQLLVRMCGVHPPRALVGPILHAIFDAIQKSPSWRVRLQALPLVQVFYFRQVPLISDGQTTEILEVLCKCLDDEVVEVREMAATTLSGVLRLSPRRSQLQLKERFLRLLKRTPLPASRHAPTYGAALRRRHAAILGICALVESYPYTVERWMPELLTGVLAECTYDPIPISTTVRRCAGSFKKTHQDTWHEDQKRFTEEQLAALSTLLTGSSYWCKHYSYYSAGDPSFDVA
ncbi:hypothetical protein K488DRAFT_76958 [Vararia minispora EC-137]|uniref:Uncharacterized protein n=1 Tax=Vararia minispora EC-137 TaxID=1314806 RepID=A0ACB8QU38_9AGAM|nr:hypothetical protein K488DRAFT_76958 [Vararia minispora EC-137]